MGSSFTRRQRWSSNGGRGSGAGSSKNCGADSQSAAPRLVSAFGRRAKKRVETSLDPAGKSARATRSQAVFNTVVLGVGRKNEDIACWECSVFVGHSRV